MIRVQIELDAFGLGVRKTTLMSIDIINTGGGTKTRGNYVVNVRDKRGKLMRQGYFDNWPRLRKHPVDLLAAALDTVRKP